MHAYVIIFYFQSKYSNFYCLKDYFPDNTAMRLFTCFLPYYRNKLLEANEEDLYFIIQRLLAGNKTKNIIHVFNDVSKKQKKILLILGFYRLSLHLHQNKFCFSLNFCD